MSASTDPDASTAERYLAFAHVEARGMSDCYEAWGRGVAEDPHTLALIDRLPADRRLPTLVFGASRYLGARAGDYAAYAAWLAEHWADVEETCRTHVTQTNEAGRCATLLPALAAIPGPLALIEVGASAGLCLYPDRYSYRYIDANGSERMLHPADGPSVVVLDCAVSGPVPVPDRMPDVVWRAGIDLNPLDVNDADDMRWLEALIWPEHDDRRARLRAAAEVARREPVHLVRGDLNDEIAQLVAQAPAGASVVVFHTVVLAYLTEAARARFARTIESLPVRWLANEGRGVVPGVTERLPVEPPTSTEFVLSLDLEPLAFTQPHGRALHWIG